MRRSQVDLRFLLGSADIARDVQVVVSQTPATEFPIPLIPSQLFRVGEKGR
jgi:hypothetical protein